MHTPTFIQTHKKLKSGEEGEGRGGAWHSLSFLYLGGVWLQITEDRPDTRRSAVEKLILSSWTFSHCRLVESEDNLEAAGEDSASGYEYFFYALIKPA